MACPGKRSRSSRDLAVDKKTSSGGILRYEAENVVSGASFALREGDTVIPFVLLYFHAQKHVKVGCHRLSGHTTNYNMLTREKYRIL